MGAIAIASPNGYNKSVTNCLIFYDDAVETNEPSASDYVCFHCPSYGLREPCRALGICGYRQLAGTL